jgi:transposase
MIQLSDTTRALLRREQKTNRDKRAYVKVTVLLMLDQGFTAEDVSASLGIDGSTVYRYIHAFEEKGLGEYLKDNWAAYEGKLNGEQEEAIKKEVSSFLYLSSGEVAAWVLLQFGIKYSSRGMVKVLRRLGFVYKKTKHVPSKADVERQKAFLAEFESFMAEKGEDTLVFFNDGVHPQHNTRPEHGWILKGDEFSMPANAGRSRLNISGALNAEDVTDVVAVEDVAVNTQSTIKVWEAIENKHPRKKIVHICDNAKYYHSQALKDWLAEHPNTSVRYLPPYAPNLNLIERLWKFMRKTAISSFFYSTFAEFKKAVRGFFNNIKEHQSALESLLTLRFHLPNWA